MKKSNEIITHLKNRSFRSKIDQVECFNKIKSLLPPRLTKAILFMYTKNKTLFFVLNHPGYKMEFNYNVNLIKRLLNRLKNQYIPCEDIEINKIKIFVSNKIEKKSQKKDFSFVEYYEKSTGNFNINTNNENLKQIFQNIQNIIKNHYN